MLPKLIAQKLSAGYYGGGLVLLDTHGELDIDKTQFPDAAAMNKQLHAMGLKSIISIWPRFEKASRYFNELDAKGYFLKDKDGKTQDGLPYRNDRTGGLIDATNPAARTWFLSTLAMAFYRPVLITLGWMKLNRI